MRRVRQSAALVTALLLLAGCQSLSKAPAESSARAAGAGDDSLTLIVSQLKMHLRDDTYRSPRFTGKGGRDVFATALWRLDRLRAQRDVSPDEWQNVDVVIEYARGRALERSRRYRAAASAFRRVAAHGSLLAERADEAARVMDRFALDSAPPESPLRDEDQELSWLRERVSAWEKLSLDYRGSSYEPLAREEAEAWSMAQVEALLRLRGVEQAIAACERLIERHHTSKLYARHLIRLGDLYAEAARREFLRHGRLRGRFDPGRYDGFLDHAFAAYELAGEQRRPTLRSEAKEKIEALLAVHDGVQARVR